MLIEFSVGNFLSIKDRQTLRMDASSISEHKDQLIDSGRYELLRSVVIYGANASGKSNVLKAMATMSRIIGTSVERSSTAEIDVKPFLLNTDTEKAPCYFEVLFLLNSIRYRYGFEADKKAVHSEWLFESKRKQEKPLFLRENDGIEVFKDFEEGKDLERKTRDNALFLSVCDQFDGEKAGKIIKWFNNFNAISGLSHERLRMVTFGLMEDEEQDRKLQSFYQQLSLGFEKVAVTKEPFSVESLPKDIPDDIRNKLVDELTGKNMARVTTSHIKYGDTGEIVGKVAFSLDEQESSGTNKLFDLSGPIFDTLQDGGVLVVDELDAKLHPLMTQAIIQLFNDPALNPNNAQLIFATHDTNLLTNQIFRRDQIYFTEKDQNGATCLYSLVEYQEENGNKIRNDRSYEKDYIKGRYGAIPFIGDLSKIAPVWQEN